MLYTSAGEWLSWFAMKHHRVRGHQMAALKTNSLRVCTGDGAEAALGLSLQLRSHFCTTQDTLMSNNLLPLLLYPPLNEENMKGLLLISLSSDWLFLQSSKVCCSRKSKRLRNWVGPMETATANSSEQDLCVHVHMHHLLGNGTGSQMVPWSPHCQWRTSAHQEQKDPAGPLWRYEQR